MSEGQLISRRDLLKKAAVGAAGVAGLVTYRDFNRSDHHTQVPQTPIASSDSQKITEPHKPSPTEEPAVTVTSSPTDTPTETATPSPEPTEKPEIKSDLDIDPFKHVDPDTLVLGAKDNETVGKWIEHKAQKYDSSLNELRLLMSEYYPVQNLETYQTQRMTFPLGPLNDPAQYRNLSNEFVNYDQYDDWIRGDAKLRKADKKKTVFWFGDSPADQELGKLAESTLHTAVYRNQQRIQSIVSGTGHVTNPETGEVMWAIQDAYYGLMDSPNPLRALVHELTHGATPSNPEIIRMPEVDGKKHLGVESGNLPAIFGFNTMWIDVARKNLEFFDKRFFSARGDATMPLICKSASNTQRAIGECIAMLCADFSIPEGIEVPLDQWPEDVIRATEITWNFIRNGNSSKLLPIPADEMDYVRSGLMNAYDIYTTTRREREAKESV